MLAQNLFIWEKKLVKNIGGKIQCVGKNCEKKKLIYLNTQKIQLFDFVTVLHSIQDLLVESQCQELLNLEGSLLGKKFCEFLWSFLSESLHRKSLC